MIDQAPATRADIEALKESLTKRVFLIVGGLLALSTTLNRLLA